jgi:two-component system, sensor histidine kinase FlrB
MLPTRTDGVEAGSLATAFAAFTASSDALQCAYRQWSSEIARLHQQLQAKDEELAQERVAAQHLRALAEVAGVLAHEVKNSLASMELFSELLAAVPEIKGDAETWIRHVQAGCRQVTATVNNVLHFHARGSAHFADLVIGEALRHAVDFVRPLASRASIDLMFSDCSEGATVLGNADQLSQVILNLTMNSITALAGRAGLIEIRVTTCAAEVRIEVHDSGPGIPAEVASALFASGVTTRPGSGGLGLAVCRRIITEHGGSIEAVEPARAGAAFVISLPRCMA